jgi:peptidoglycan/xylan/chitin deacetylase (PgdA/CDA1 family)
MLYILRKVMLIAVLYSSLLSAVSAETLSPQVVVMQYHHVATNTPSVTSVTPDTFLEHMQYLSKHHSVISLKTALDAIKQNKPLPENAVAITFDDGYANILENAHPILLDFDFPYTIFINPQSISSQSDQLTWEEVISMQPLADFANHTLDHIHLLERINNESETQWLSRVMDNILQAETILEQKLGYSHRWLAYPFGEFNQALQTALQAADFIGFGQQSGVVSTHSNFGALPRFPSSGRYANLETLKVKMKSIAMPVQSVSPAQNEQALGAKIEQLELTLFAPQEDLRVDAMACFFGNERIVPQIDESTASITLNHTFKAGRTRVNCTAPSRSQSGRFYWYSMPFFTPTKEGIFLD